MRLLLLGKGAVLAHRFERPLAAELDESEQRQARGAGTCWLFLSRMRASPPLGTRTRCPPAWAPSHSRIRRERAAAPALSSPMQGIGGVRRRSGARGMSGDGRTGANVTCSLRRGCVPFVSPSPGFWLCRAKALRNHNPRVGGSSPSSGIISACKWVLSTRRWSSGIIPRVPPLHDARFGGATWCHARVLDIYVPRSVRPGSVVPAKVADVESTAPKRLVQASQRRQPSEPPQVWSLASMSGSLDLQSCSSSTAVTCSAARRAPLAQGKAGVAPAIGESQVRTLSRPEFVGVSDGIRTRDRTHPVDGKP